MIKTIGKALSIIGVLLATVIVIVGWRHAIFSSSQTGAAIGLRRIFFLFVYIPAAIGVAIVGSILAFGSQVNNAAIKKTSLVASVFFFLLALGFITMNISSNVRYYEGEGLIFVVLMNLILAAPMLFLGGLLYWISRGGMSKRSYKR